MAHYILVHGAWEGSWTWEDTIPTLEKKGHTVTTVDLPGSIGNKQAIPLVTLASYVQTVIDVVERFDHKVILAGHSLGGAVISGVAERLPEKVERLIYVTAFLLKNGDSVYEAMKRDPDGEYLPALNFSEDQSYVTVSEQALRDIAFHDVADSEIQRILPLMAERQASEPFVAPFDVSEERFGSVPKTYIRTTIDKIVSPALQNEMISTWPVDTVHVLESGHFPTLSVPEQLATVMG